MFLLRDGRFCCLGVLCDLARAAGIVKLNEGTLSVWSYDEGTLNVWSYDERIVDLPEKVLRWAGLTEPNGPHVTISERSGDLVHHNDAGASFAEIADAIERTL